MRNVLPISLIVCLCLCLSASPQVSTQRQRPVMPATPSTGTGKVDLFIKSVQGANSFAEVSASYNQAQFTQDEHLC
jgi:hypothetical protein